MNSMGLSLIFRMGCLCSKETIVVNNKKYVIREHLGEGAFSTVVLIEDGKNQFSVKNNNCSESNHKKYALKKIICHGTDDEAQALREIKYYSMIQHPNVIQCIDSMHRGTPDPVINSTSQVLIVLPYFHKGTLAQELERRARTNDYLQAIDILHIFLQICEGVQAFHEAKPEPLAHRDLKTANIMLHDGMTPIIMDLGSTALARVKVCGAHEAQTLQDIAAERCSMPYRAPELFTVESYCMIDERTDIWSLGCILYAMCYFKSPFDAVYERGDSVALAVMSANITFPENFPYNEDMQNLILAMLKVNPMERPYIYSVIEGIHDELAKLENRV